MASKHLPQSVTIGVLVGIVVLFGILVFSQRNSASLPYVEKPVPTEMPVGTGASITVKGVIDCLPHRDTSGPQTEECAFGLKAESGEYYGLTNLSEERMLKGEITVGKKVTIVGTVTATKDTQYAAEKSIDVKTVTVEGDVSGETGSQPTTSNTTSPGAGMYAQ